MAKRSDFAQKLLDDLRLRKERLAASQSSVAAPNAKARDAYTSTKQSFRGSSNHGKAAMRVDGTQRRSNGANKAFSREGSSGQLVPFGKGHQGSPQIGDLSMVLAFALENGGKLRHIDSSGRSSVLTFLPQVGRNGHKVQGNRGGIPTISHVHLQEISKGAQKLNQILRACSDGANFDRYSIEIGKELLKGAMDLQESLKMLANLQDASNFMVRPQRKSRIVLLEDDKEIEEEEEAAKEIEKKQLDLLPRFSFDKQTRSKHHQKQQRLPALVYPLESTLSPAATHRRSASHGSEARGVPALQEKKNVSIPSTEKPEKGRMSSVIAKLMGLEEVPRNTEPKRVQTKVSEPKTKENVGPAAPFIKPDITKPVKSDPLTSKDAVSFVLKAEKNFPNRSTANVAVKFQEKPPWKNPENAKAMVAMDRAFIDQLRKQVKIQSGLLTKQNEIGPGEAKLQEKVELNERKVPMPRSRDSPNEKQREPEKRQQVSRQKKGNEPIPKAPAQKGRPNVNQMKPKKYVPADAVQLKSSKESPRLQQVPRGGKTTEQDKTDKPKISRVKKIPGTTLQDQAKPVQQRTASQEVKKHSNNAETNAASTESINNAVKETKLVSPDSPRKFEESQSMEKKPRLAPEDSVRRVLSSVANDRDTAGVSDVDEKLRSAKAILNQYSGTTKDTENSMSLHKRDKENVPAAKVQEPLTKSETRLKQILVKSRLFLNTAEGLLKLNIPVGILDVSGGQNHPHEDNDTKLALDSAFEIIKRKGRRLELAIHPFTKRACIGYAKIMSFDDVVRQLEKSFEGLRSHGRNGRRDCQVEDYLPMMLELDIQARDPETDCMWDIGWDGPTFAVLEKDEVVKDVEKMVISGLIDEMARDLLHL